VLSAAQAATCAAPAAGSTLLLRVPAAVESIKTRGLGYRLMDAQGRALEAAVAGHPVAAAAIGRGSGQLVVDVAGAAPGLAGGELVRGVGACLGPQLPAFASGLLQLQLPQLQRRLLPAFLLPAFLLPASRPRTRTPLPRTPITHAHLPHTHTYHPRTPTTHAHLTHAHTHTYRRAGSWTSRAGVRCWRRFRSRAARSASAGAPRCRRARR
jgi:hypothetical protein